jgi:hypothetical protein
VEDEQSGCHDRGEGIAKESPHEDSEQLACYDMLGDAEQVPSPGTQFVQEEIKPHP